jgi:hypothetical protein
MFQENLNAGFNYLSPDLFALQEQDWPFFWRYSSTRT